MKNILLLLASLFIFANCAFAPFTTPKSGRAIGEGNWEIEGGILPTLTARVAYGINDRWDAGIIVEQQFGSVISAYGKYSFVNQQEGWSVSGYGGGFVGGGFGSARGSYVGPIVSYRKKWFEPYLSVRYNHVTWDVVGIDQSDLDDSNITITSTDTDLSFGYIQTDLGINFWTGKSFAININGKLWTSLSKDVVDFSETGIIPGFQLIFTL